VTERRVRIELVARFPDAGGGEYVLGEMRVASVAELADLLHQAGDVVPAVLDKPID
jgi:hypothetical protein